LPILVPLAGGIVEVVLSIGAVTGGALYMPAIWALFSSRQNGKSILWATAISLAVNLFFKFISPSLLDFALDRSMEMLVGVGIPFLLLFLYEMYASSVQVPSPSPSGSPHQPEFQASTIQVQNLFWIKVLGIAFIAIGSLFLILTTWAFEAAGYMLLMGILIIGLGAYMYGYANRLSRARQKALIKEIFK